MAALRPSARGLLGGGVAGKHPAMHRFVSLSALLVLAASLVAPSCDKTRGVAPLRDGLVECADMTDLCREPAALGGDYQTCFELGQDNDGDACLRVWKECEALCKAAPEGQAGAGGQGGGAG